MRSTRRDRSRHPSEEAKWRRLHYITLALATVAVAWALTLGSILLVRSGHTVDKVLGLVENGQQQRRETVEHAQQTAAEREALRKSQVARSAEAVQRERRRAQAEITNLRTQIQEERATRQSLALAVLARADAADLAATRTALRAALARLGAIDDQLVASIDRLQAAQARARVRGESVVTEIQTSLRRLERLRGDVRAGSKRIRRALGHQARSELLNVSAKR